jgi:hypothetical protein
MVSPWKASRCSPRLRGIPLPRAVTAPLPPFGNSYGLAMRVDGASPADEGCDSTDVNKNRRRQAGGMPTRHETLEVDELLADLDRAREMFEAAERRARTYLVRRGVIDQTDRDLRSLLRECGLQ